MKTYKKTLQLLLFSSFMSTGQLCYDWKTLVNPPNVVPIGSTQQQYLCNICIDAWVAN